MSFDAMLAHPRIQAARAHLERTDQATLERQALLSAAPAATGGEGLRAARGAELFREVGLRDVKVDVAGNVLGWLGERGTGGPVVLAAHLDTVFGPEIDVTVQRHGARLEGPGISDNARGLAALIALAEACVRGRVETQRPLLFAATVGEEGAGDLRGVKHLLSDGLPRAFAFIALDGAGVERIVHRALGSKRYRATYRGPGGHSWAAFGVANPATAVGLAATAIAEQPTPNSPRTTAAVVRLGGGTGLNSIPQEAWLDLDLRSEDPHSLAELDGRVRAALARAKDEENRRRTPGTPPLQLEIQLLGDRPSGLTPRTHPLVQAALAATRAMGKEGELAAASTDANVPIALGIPAIALGAGGRAGDAHLTTECYGNDGGVRGLIRALLVAAAVAGGGQRPA